MLLKLNKITMSDTKTFYFPDQGNSCANMMSMLANNGGFNGNNGWWIILLFLLWGRNGWGNDNGVSVPQMLSNGEGREFLMQAINGNTSAINQLAGTLNCDINSVKSALNTIQSAICNVGNQVGMSSQAVINSIQSGNMALTQQLCSCCCDLKSMVTAANYENQISNLNQTNQLLGRIDTLANGVQTGFASTAYETQSQTCALRDNANDNTRAILAKLDSIEDSRKDREIAALTAQLTASTSRAERQAELAPIIAQLNEIKCAQPQTVTLPYSCATAVPTTALYNGLYYNQGNGFL